MLDIQKSDVKDFFSQLWRITKGFLKAQAIFFLIDLGLIWLVLALCQLRGAFWIALGVSVVDMLPVLGSGLIFLPWILVCLFTSRQSLALCLALLYIGLVLLREVLGPLITGKQIGLKPLLALGASLAGALILGPLGLILGPILAALVKVILDIREKKNRS